MPHRVRLTGSWPVTHLKPALRFAALLGASAWHSAGCALLRPKDPHPQVLLQTSQGDIRLELDREHAPLSVDNFINYVQERGATTGYPRVPSRGCRLRHPGRRLRCRSQGPAAPRADQAGIRQRPVQSARHPGAAARDEAPNTADAEFYINLVDNLKLNPHPDIPGRGLSFRCRPRLIEPAVSSIQRFVARHRQGAAQVTEQAVAS